MEPYPWSRMKQQTTPPAWADRFLKWFCSEELLEEIQGDLAEAFDHRVKHDGLQSARRQYVIDVLRFFRPYAFEQYSATKQFIPMFQNYVKIAIRNILKRKGYTLLNVSGLTIGLAAVMLIGIYLRNEWTYDQSIPDYERVYRLVRDYRVQSYACMHFPGYYNTPPADQLRLPNFLKDQEGIEVACQFVLSDSDIGDQEQKYLQWEGKKYISRKILYTNTGKEFQEIFHQSLILGNEGQAFGAMKNLILTKPLAEKIFGKAWDQGDFLEQTVELGGESYLISGVVESPPGNLHFDYEMIVVQETIPSWGAYTYFRAGKYAEVSQLTQQINAEIGLVYPGFHEDILEKGIHSIPVTELHHTNTLLYELKPTADPVYLWTFFLVGIVILLIVWTNYANLSIAMYTGRQRELGIRKLFGARAKDISRQIMVEAVVLALIAFPLSSLLLSMLLPVVNDQMGLRLSFSADSFTLFLGLSIVIGSGLMSSIYPAFVYGKKSLIHLFYENLQLTKGRQIFSLRNALLLIQFVVLVGLLSSTAFIFQQLAYLESKDLGFDSEDVFFFDIDDVTQYESIRSDLGSEPSIASVGTGLTPGNEMYNQGTYKLLGSEEILSDGTMEETDVSSLKVLGIDCKPCEALKNGKSSVYVINQTAARKLATIQGVEPEELIGETLVLEPEWENEEFGFGIHYTIDGIIEDYHYFSLKYEHQSMLMEVFAEPAYAYRVLVRAKPGKWAEAMSAAEDAYRSVGSEKPFTSTSLSGSLQKLYQSEKQAGILMAGLSVIVVVLSLMGILGLVSFITFTRRKETGLRKVFGASVMDILLRLNHDFVILLAIATIVALPMSLLLIDSWLELFAFHINPSPWITVVAGGFVLILIIVSVILYAANSARQNPIEVLAAE